jgi:hypothetical protein
MEASEMLQNDMLASLLNSDLLRGPMVIGRL